MSLHSLELDKKVEDESLRGRGARGCARILWQGRGGGRAGPDVKGELARRGLLAELGRGQVALGGELLLLAAGIDRVILGFASRFHARRFEYPMLIPLEVLVRARYLENFPQYLTFACHLQEDPDLPEGIAAPPLAQEGFPNTAGRKGMEAGPVRLGPLDHVLCPAVCLHAYGHLAGTRFAEPTAMAARSRCARYEGSGLGGPERLWDFTMREVIFFGPADWVASARERALLFATDLVRRLDLSGHVTTATDSFIGDAFRKKASFQLAFETKYELRLDTALDTGPDAAATLAVGSFNLHHEHFARAFDLGLEGGAPLATGCVGFGLERFAYAIACQHGADPSGWPTVARELVREEAERIA